MLTASIVTFHTSGQELRECLEALQNSCVDKITVIDNASEDRIRGIVVLFDKAEYIPSSNVGYGAAHNKGIKRGEELGAEYHLVLNTDTVFNSEDITELLRHIEAAEDIALVHPRIMDKNNNDLYTSRMLPTPFDLFIRRFLPRSFFKKRRDIYLLKHLDHDIPQNIPYHQGSFLMMRMSALKDCGGFDERFFMYPEDIDLCRRLHANYRTLYVPTPGIIHNHRASSYKSMYMLGVHITNIIRYFNKWGWWNDPGRKTANQRLLPNK
ncbi:MAG: glycosyltransferase family 2 protein [Paramuribaculum sp.]|nr:glycosyltransferase family 2 protein [Paramuribaculum sp.]